ncbi:Diguanylate cyclase [Bosea sp. LC85]|nr:Diguanylate cyclase [Bosea sp. LC85]
MNLVPTAILFLFAATFGAVWLFERRSWYLLHFAQGFLAFGIGMLVQTTRIPADFGLNTMLYGVLYVFGTLVFVTGVMARSARRPPRWFHVIWFAGIIGALGYFFYVDRNLVARVHVVSFGLGGIIASASWIMRSLARGGATDRVIFWLVLVLACIFSCAHCCLPSWLRQHPRLRSCSRGPGSGCSSAPRCSGSGWALGCSWPQVWT